MFVLFVWFFFFFPAGNKSTEAERSARRWLKKEPLVPSRAPECGASRLTGSHHHSSLLMSDCWWADEIKL